MIRPSFLVGCLLAFAVLVICAPARAQLVLGGLESDSAVELPVAEDPSTVVRSTLLDAEDDLTRRLEREQDQARWHLERLDSRRVTLRTDITRLRDRRLTLRRLGGPERLVAINELLMVIRDTQELLERISDERAAHEAALNDGVTEARRLNIELSSPMGLEEVQTTFMVDGHIEGLEVAVVRAQASVSQSGDDLDSAAKRLEERRDLLTDARRLLVEQEPELPSLEFLGPPARADGVAVPPGPNDEKSSPALVAADPMELSEAEVELLDLRDELLRAEVTFLERQVELDRLRVRTTEVLRETAAFAGPVLALQLKRWKTRRESIAAREQGGLLNRTEGLFTRDVYIEAAEHAASMFRGEKSIRATVAGQIRPPTERAGALLLAAILAVGVLLMSLARRLRGPLASWRPGGRGDEVVKAAAEAALPLLSVAGVCALLVGLNATPAALSSLLAFGAFGPISVAVALAVTNRLFVADGPVTEGAARYLRRLARGVGAGAALVLLVGSMLPLLGFPESVRVRLGELLLGALVLAWVLAGIQRAAVLQVFGAHAPGERGGALRAGIRRLYQAFVWGPVVVYGLYATGYANLAEFLVRGGSITLGVLLFAPWVYSRSSGLLRLAVGYPDGGGWLALSAAGSRTAVRSVAPVLMLLFAFVTLSLIASGWGYGDLGGNLLGALTWPLLKVGGSRISFGSILLLTVIISATVVASRWFVRLLGEHVYPLYDLDKGMQATFDTLTRYAIIAMGTVAGLDAVGAGSGVITVFAGVVGIGLGFGSQTLMAHFISGMILLLARPVSVDSVIEVGGIIGRVVRISSYATVIQTLDNHRVIVPNAEIINQHVINWSLESPSVRMQLVVGVAYESNPAEVEELLLRAARENRRVLSKPAPSVRFDDFGDSALVFTLLPWIRDLDGRYEIASELRFRIFELLGDAGVEIPFPQRDLHLRPVADDVALDTRTAAEANGWEVREAPGNSAADGSSS